MNGDATPRDPAFMDAIGNQLWVTCSATHYLKGHDTTTGAEVGSYYVNRDPAFMDADQWGRLWIPCALDNILQVRQV